MYIVYHISPSVEPITRKVMDFRCNVIVYVQITITRITLLICDSVYIPIESL